MSGHSHANTIKRDKELTDQVRGRVFSKLIKEIAIAARDGVDPETNFKLRLVIERAKQANMPKDNIIRALKKGSGELGSGKWEGITYEGYGPFGVGVIVETVTDNRNRISQELKNIFERAGGSIASPGSVSFQFKKTGVIKVEKATDADKQILQLIDLGVEDVKEEQATIEVITKPEQLKEIKEKIEKEGFRVNELELIMQPANFISFAEPQKVEKVLKFIEGLEENDDVQKVYTNFR